MGRLTERFSNGQAAVYGCGNNCKYDFKYCENHLEDCPTINEIYEKLAEYEDLDEQGKLPKLPCAVGDKLFHVGKEPKRIREFTVWDITIVKDNVIIRTEEDISFEAKHIGVDLFLTQEEAKATRADRNLCRRRIVTDL